MEILAYVGVALLVLVTILAVLITILALLARPFAFYWVPTLANALTQGKAVGWPLVGLVTGWFVNHINWMFTAMEETMVKVPVAGTKGKGSLIKRSKGAAIEVQLVKEDPHGNLRLPDVRDGQVKNWSGDGVLWTSETLAFLRYQDFVFDQFCVIRHKDTNGHVGVRWDDARQSYMNYIIVLPRTDELEMQRLPPWIPPFVRSLIPENIYYVGNPFRTTIWEYNFQWQTIRQVPSKDRPNELVDVVIYEDRSDKPGASGPPLDYVYAKDDVYVVTVKAVETMERIQVDIELLLTIRIVEPLKALFRVEQWLEATTNRIQPAVRSWGAEKSYVDLVKKKEPIRRELDDILKTTEVGDLVERQWGVRIKAVGIRGITLVGELSKQFLELTTKEYAAEQQGKATIIAAQKNGEAAVIQATKEGEARVIRAAMEAEAIGKLAGALEMTQFGSAILGASTLEKVSANPAKVILPISSLADFLKSFTGTEKTKVSDGKEGDK